MLDVRAVWNVSFSKTRTPLSFLISSDRAKATNANNNRSFIVILWVCLEVPRICHLKKMTTIEKLVLVSISKKLIQNKINKFSCIVRLLTALPSASTQRYSRFRKCEKADVLTLQMHDSTRQIRGLMRWHLGIDCKISIKRLLR